ncbi:DPP IV N-terminal domain-containing protein [Zobellia laminariae]|uniref:DPP IV N-terminal domain-containing protein n=1 Tax=Zobellia laminariae TaxID=248906 RepID=UPI00191E1B61
MTMKKMVWINLLAILLFANLGYAQEAKTLTLADIYKNGEFGQKGFGPVRWMKDNKGYSTLEESTNLAGKDIVKYDAKTGKRAIVVSASDLIPKGSEKPLVIKDYKWSDDNTKLLVFTNTRKVWRYHTRGDYWVLNLATKKLSQLGKSLPEATLMFAKFSPDGSRVGYVSDLNIYVEEVSSNSITQITKDGGGDI